MNGKIPQSDKEWQKRLTPEEFAVCRRKGTEPAFSGKYWNCKDEGVYRCSCCGAELFSSETKFDSGTGWPSFRAPLAEGPVEEKDDFSHGMKRVEVICRECGAHLGHVFEDGPEPAGKRYCINSVSLKMKKSHEDAD